MEQIGMEVLAKELVAGDGEHVWGEIESGDLEAPTGKVEDVTPGAAAEVEEAAGVGEAVVEDMGVEMEEADAFEVAVVVEGDVTVIDILPSALGNGVPGVVEVVVRKHALPYRRERGNEPSVRTRRHCNEGCGRCQRWGWGGQRKSLTGMRCGT